MNQQHPPRPDRGAARSPAEHPSPSLAAESAQAAEAPDAPAPAVPYPSGVATLRYRNLCIELNGRALHHILWLAAHRSAINSIAAENGQIWLTWKGSAIAGEIRTRL